MLEWEEGATRLAYYVAVRAAGQGSKAERRPGGGHGESFRKARPTAQTRALLPESQVYRRRSDVPALVAEHYRAAGVLPFAVVSGEALVLLGQESSKKRRDPGAVWSVFGGKREGSDRSLERTAAREFVEETGGSAFAGQERAIEDQLRSSAAPVLWLKEALYCLFVMQIPYIEITASWIHSIESTSIQSTSIDSTSIQSTSIQSTSIQSTSIQSTSIQSIESSSIDSSSIQSSSSDQLSRRHKKKRLRAQMSAAKQKAKQQAKQQAKKNPCHEKSEFDWLSVSDVRALLGNQASTVAATSEQRPGKRDKPDGQEPRRLAGYFHGLLALPDAVSVLEEHLAAATAQKKQKTD